MEVDRPFFLASLRGDDVCVLPNHFSSIGSPSRYAIKPRALELRTAEPRALERRPKERRTLELRPVEHRALEPRETERRTLEPRAVASGGLK